MAVTPSKMSCFLVVDDFESIRRVVIKNLNAMGHQAIFQASNGQTALRALEQHPEIDFVITDWNMPLMSGIELLREIRGNPKYKALPVLMITAEIARSQVQEAVTAGVSGFLVKPFSAGSLKSKLDQIAENLKNGTKPSVPTNTSAATNNGMNAVLPTETQNLIISDDLQARLTRQAVVLVVDDIADNIEVLIGLLQNDYKMLAAKSGDMALKMLNSGKQLPDLILLDVMMPGMDGFEVCRRLKANPATAGIPVIFLTASGDTDNVVQGFGLGAVDYVTKPADPTILRARVRNHLTRSLAFAELQKQYQMSNEIVRLREEVERIGRHDLKNPIGGIINFSGMLLAESNLTADQREILEAIDDSARRVLTMVNMSLDLFKIEQGRYDLQPTRIDLALLLSQILSEQQEQITAKQLQVSNTLPTEKPTAVQGDEILCYSVFSNLISNALDAAPEKGRLEIALSDAPKAGFVAVALTNSGAVPEEIREIFFNKYVTAGKIGGTGLGTYSAKIATEVQRGSVAMRSSTEENETTVTVTLPLALA